MNRFTRLIKENLLPFVVFVLIVGACCAAWFFFHPSSPYHARYRFVVSFDAVGTLSPGNRVDVRGISRGEIVKVELADEAVYVTVQVLATTKIPKNSEFRLINSGLMGERQLSVLTGDSEEWLAPGDTMVGKYDEGTAGIGRKLSSIISDMREIKDSVHSVLDSLSEGETGLQLKRVTRKADRMVDRTKSNVVSWKAGVDDLLVKCDSSLETAQIAIDEVASRGGVKINEVRILVDRTRALLSKVQELKDEGNRILGKLADGDNSAALLFDKNAAFNQELNKLIQDVQALINDIKKSGAKLNVDIF